MYIAYSIHISMCRRHPFGTTHRHICWLHVQHYVRYLTWQYKQHTNLWTGVGTPFGRRQRISSLPPMGTTCGVDGFGSNAASVMLLRPTSVQQILQRLERPVNYPSFIIHHTRMVSIWTDHNTILRLIGHTFSHLLTYLQTCHEHMQWGTDINDGWDDMLCQHVTYVHGAYYGFLNILLLTVSSLHPRYVNNI